MYQKLLLIIVLVYILLLNYNYYISIIMLLFVLLYVYCTEKSFKLISIWKCSFDRCLHYINNNNILSDNNFHKVYYEHNIRIYKHFTQVFEIHICKFVQENVYRYISNLNYNNRYYSLRRLIHCFIQNNCMNFLKLYF